MPLETGSAPAKALRGETMDDEGPRFEDLPAWQAAMDFTMAVYRATDAWPEVERDGLAAELRHEAVVVPSKIAAAHALSEGSPALAAAAFGLARAALRDVEMRLHIARDLGLLEAEIAAALLARVEGLRPQIDALLGGQPEPPVEIDPFAPPFHPN
jgi:four helix bundle protein